jgi:Cys-tRNA(Pro) deacylase
MNAILDKEPVKRAEKSLKKFDEKLEVICLEQSARTAQDAATALGCDVGAIVKSLLFKAGDRFILGLVAGDRRCSLNKLKKILNEKDVSMASPDQVKENTGYTIGGVSPVGHLKECEIFIDETLVRFNDIFGAAGHPNAVFKIDYNNLIDMTKGLPKDIVE